MHARAVLNMMRDITFPFPMRLILFRLHNSPCMSHTAVDCPYSQAEMERRVRATVLGPQVRAAKDVVAIGHKLWQGPFFV